MSPVTPGSDPFAALGEIELDDPIAEIDALDFDEFDEPAADTGEPDVSEGIQPDAEVDAKVDAEVNDTVEANNDAEVDETSDSAGGSDEVDAEVDAKVDAEVNDTVEAEAPAQSDDEWTEPDIHITMVGKGLRGHNGFLGRHEFKDGRSVKPIPIRDALRIAAGIACIDDDEKPLHPTTHKMRYNPSRRPAPNVRYLPGERESGNEVKAQPKPSANAPKDAATRDQYSRQDLEEIADQQGIEGLRKIAESYNVKDRSIQGLITGIIQAERGQG